MVDGTNNFTCDLSSLRVRDSSDEKTTGSLIYGFILPWVRAESSIFIVYTEPQKTSANDPILGLFQTIVAKPQDSFWILQISPHRGTRPSSSQKTLWPKAGRILRQRTLNRFFTYRRYSKNAYHNLAFPGIQADMGANVGT